MWSKVKIGLRATFEGADPLAIIAAAQELGWVPARLDDGLGDVDGQELEEPEPLGAMLSRAKRSIGINFAEYPQHVAVSSLTEPTMTRIGNTSVTIDMSKLANQLQKIPFELASFANLHMTKFNEKLPGDPRVSPGPMHDRIGWALAFRGRGHERLVSTRWLAAGPWVLWTAGDVSVVQLHALDVDLETALKQAAPAYAKLDVESSETGLLHPYKKYVRTLAGTADPKTKLTHVEALGELPGEELLAWAAARVKTAFVFPTEEVARAEVPRVWPYGHQTWAKDKRVDADYSPPNMTPTWARK